MKSYKLQVTNYKLQRGIAALPAILAISAIILIIGLAIAFSGRVESSISASHRDSGMAFHVAEAGIHDAEIKIVRNPDFEDLVGYTLTVGDGTTTITVDKDAPSSGKTTIISQGEVKNIKRKIRVIVDADPQGKVTLYSWEEMTD